MNLFAAGTKRVLDIALVLLSLPVTVPVIALLAVLVKLESRGPALFRQVRVGKDGRHFTIVKLRTMVVNAEHTGAGIFFEKDDPRILRIGRFARRFSLDELPQVINVLAGTMSLVGPRPMLPVTVAEHADAYQVILRVKPGITGLTQVSGRNALTRSERLAMDQQYVRTRSLALDLAILARTVGVALLGSGQLNDQSREEVER